MHATVPMSAPISFPTDLATGSLMPRASVGFLAFSAFSVGRLGKPGVGLSATGPRSPAPEARPFPVCGISRFSGLFCGMSGKTGGGVLASGFLLGTLHSALGTQHSVYGLVNLKLKLGTETGRVTWA
jgi:hypothetical protein